MCVDLHTALRCTLVLQVAQSVVGTVEITCSGVVGWHPAGPHGGHNNCSVAPHAINDRLLGTAIESRRVVESPLCLSILAELHGQITVIRHPDVDIERSVAVNGASEVEHLSASPGVTPASVGPHKGMHSTRRKLVSIGLKNIQLDTSVSSVHERLTVVAVEVAAAHQCARDHKIQVGIHHVVNSREVHGEFETTAHQVKLLLRVITHASLARKAIANINVSIFVDEIAWLEVAWTRAWRGRSWVRWGSWLPSFAANLPAVRSVVIITCTWDVDPIAVAIASHVSERFQFGFGFSFLNAPEDETCEGSSNKKTHFVN